MKNLVAMLIECKMLQGEREVEEVRIREKNYSANEKRCKSKS